MTKVLRVLWDLLDHLANQLTKEILAPLVHQVKLELMEWLENEDLKVHKVYKVSPVLLVLEVHLVQKVNVVYQVKKVLKETLDWLDLLVKWVLKV